MKSGVFYILPAGAALGTVIYFLNHSNNGSNQKFNAARQTSSVSSSSNNQSQNNTHPAGNPGNRMLSATLGFNPVTPTGTIQHSIRLFGKGTTDFNEYNFEGSLPSDFTFINFVEDEVYNIIKQQEITAENANDINLQQKIYKHKQLSFTALWSITSPKNSQETSFTNPDFGVITEYGCWCMPSMYNDFTIGHGTPVDLIDKACRDRARCTKCAISEFKNCQATSGYSFQAYTDSMGRRGITCDENTSDSCQKALCQCDAAFVETLGSEYKNYNKDYDRHNFNRNSGCHSSSSSSNVSEESQSNTSPGSVNQPVSQPISQPVSNPVDPPIVPINAPVSQQSNNPYHYQNPPSQPDTQPTVTHNDNSNSYNYDDNSNYETYDNYYGPYNSLNLNDNYGDAYDNSYNSYNDYNINNYSNDNAYDTGYNNQYDSSSFLDYFNTEQNDPTQDNPDYDINEIFNHLSGNWEELQPNDPIYDQYTWDDPEEMVDTQWTSESYEHFSNSDIDQIKTSYMNKNDVGLGLEDEAIVRRLTGSWTGEYIEPPISSSSNINTLTNIDHTNYNQVNDYYSSSSDQNDFIDYDIYDSNLLEEPLETCCGVYPKRYPFVESSSVMCCKYGTYNPLTHSCCGEHVLDGLYC